MILLQVMLACDPYARWPDPQAVFPYVVAPPLEQPDYVDARVETQTWTPLEDVEQTALYIEKSFAHWPGASNDVLVHFAEHRPRLPSLASGLQLDFVGDILPVSGSPEALSSLALGAESLFDGELAIGNLETPTAPGLQAPGIYAFNTDPALLDSLPLQVLQLNNNHTLDAGVPGVFATLDEVRARGFEPVGVDNHVLVHTPQGAVALLSYTWGLNATPDPSVDLFVVPFGHEGIVDLSRVSIDVAHARDRGAELVVVLVHWGYEYEYYPDPHFLRTGRELIATGADLVVGQGPHVVQPAEICAVDQPNQPPGRGACSVRTPENRARTAAILYSLGNFSSDMLTLQTQVGIVASVTLDPQLGVTGLGWRGVATVPTSDGPRIAPLDELLEDPLYAEESARLDAHIGTRWRRAPVTTK